MNISSSIARKSGFVTPPSLIETMPPPTPPAPRKPRRGARLLSNREEMRSNDENDCEDKKDPKCSSDIIISTKTCRKLDFSGLYIGDDNGT